MPNGHTGALTLDQWLEFAVKNSVNDDVIYNFLAPPLPPNCVSRWLARIERIEGMPKPQRVAAAEWSGKKNSKKGHAFERMIKSIIRSIPSFYVSQNVTTTTNEIDLLVQVGLAVQASPVIREWGTHFLCECKLVKKSVNATWVGKLNSLLELHGSQ